MLPPTEEVVALVREGSGWVGVRDSFAISYNTREPQSVLVVATCWFSYSPLVIFDQVRWTREKGNLSEGVVNQPPFSSFAPNSMACYIKLPVLCLT